MNKFNSGDLAYSDTKQELHKLYAVNEKIHSRGAILVVLQIALFFMVLWGLNLIVHAPSVLRGSWSIFNLNILSEPVSFVVPFLASLIYFLHSLIKIYFKEKEDYISSEQTLFSITFAIFASAVVYWFASIFAITLTIYFATLMTFSTIRYIVVEQKARKWGKLAQKELIQDLQKTKLHKNKFEYISRKWNHIPVIRYMNFHLLEEAVSMSLGLLIALNFFGI